METGEPRRVEQGLNTWAELLATTTTRRIQLRPKSAVAAEAPVRPFEARVLVLLHDAVRREVRRAAPTLVAARAWL